MKLNRGKVLVKLAPKKEKTFAGLIVPDTSDAEGTELVEILAWGEDPCPGTNIDTAPYAEGDTALIYKGCGKDFTHPETGERLRVISSSEIIVIL